MRINRKATHYEYTRVVGKNGRVTYTIHDVEMFAVGDSAPIAAVPEEVKQARSVLLTRKFALKAINTCNRKIERGYKPPAHIGHNEKQSGMMKGKVGFFEAISFGNAKNPFRPDPNVVYCDITGIKPKAFASIADEDLPYRSVEVLSANNPDFSSLALMFSTPPYLQFRNLKVELGKEGWSLLKKDIKAVKGLEIERLMSREDRCPTVCFSATDSEQPSYILARVGDGKMKLKKKTKHPIKLQAGGGKQKGVGRLDRLEKLMAQFGRQLQVLLDERNGEDDVSPVANKAGSKKPVHLAAIGTLKKRNKLLSHKLHKLEARIDNETNLNIAKEKYADIYEMFAAARQEGYDVDPEAETLRAFELSKKKPLTVARDMVKKIRQQAPKFDVGNFEADENADVMIDEKDPLVKKFIKAGEPEAIVKCAAGASQAYDEAVHFGATSLTREEYVLAEVYRLAAGDEENGIQPIALQRDYYKDLAKRKGLLKQAA